MRHPAMHAPQPVLLARTDAHIHTHTHMRYTNETPVASPASLLAVSRTEERRGSETEELEECALSVIGTAAPVHSAGCQHENSRIFPSAHVRCRNSRKRERDREGEEIPCAEICLSPLEASRSNYRLSFLSRIYFLLRFFSLGSPALRSGEGGGRCASYSSAICIVGQVGRLLWGNEVLCRESLSVASFSRGIIEGDLDLTPI